MMEVWKVNEILGFNLIAGQFVASGEKRLRSISAADGSVHPVEFRVATDAEVREAATAAASAFDAFVHSPPRARADLLEAIAVEIDGLGTALIEQASRETGLSAARLEAERARTVAQLRMFAELIVEPATYGVCVEAALPARLPSPRPEMRRGYTGLGPVAVFGSSNFPLAFSVAGGDTASALAAGCPVVVKAHPGHLVTSELVANAVTRAVRRTGQPPGIFSLLVGAHETGSRLVQEPAIQAVAFTGSLAAGRALFDLAARRDRPIPVFAEMSSINPVIVFPHAQRVRGGEIAQQFGDSIRLGNGQFCTKPGLILVIGGSSSAEFVTGLQAAFGTELLAPMLNEAIATAYRAGVRMRSHADDVRWISPHAADQRLHAELFSADASAFRKGAAVLREELFGPAATVVVVDDEPSLLEGLQHLSGQLTATVFGESEDFASIASVLPTLEKLAGRLVFNGVPTGVEVNRATVHGGPYPATSDARFTSVGAQAMERFRRPICYQNFPAQLLPAHLR